MSSDRRPFDPFAPPPASVGAPSNREDDPPQEANEAAREAAEQIPADLNDITKDDLIALAELADVATYGTKAEIAARIRSAAGL